MRALIWIFILFAAAAGLAMLADANQGFVLVVLPPWRLQISLNFAIVALAVFVVAVYLVIRLLSGTLNMPSRFSRYRAGRKEKRAALATREALRALTEARYSDALREARKAFNAGGGSEPALLAARAAHARRDDSAYREWMNKASMAGGRNAVLLTRAELAIADGAWGEAEDALINLRKQDHTSLAAMKLHLALAQGKGEWEVVPGMVKGLLSNRLLAPEEARKLDRKAQIARLQELVADPEAMGNYWRSLEKSAHNDSEFLIAATPVLARAGKGALARRMVERVLDKEWNSTLARLYALCGGEGDEAREAMSRTESWLRAHPEDAGLLYAAGRHCMTAQLWGKAQSYLEKSLAIETRPEVHLALAELFDATANAEQAHSHYAQAARLSGAS